MRRHRSPRDRTAVIEWAQNLFKLKNFYVLDTETTGTGKSDEVIQIGIIDKAGMVVLDTLLKPTKKIDPGASAVNGITMAMVRDAPEFVDVYTTLSTTLAGAQVVAYNMDFDWRILTQTARRYKLPMFRTGERHCAMKQYATYRGIWNGKYRSYRWHSLTDAAAYEDITIVNAHTALGDVYMTLELLKKIAAYQPETDKPHNLPLGL